MGYYVQSYLTEANKIKNLFGCKDENIFIELSEQLAEQLDDLNNDFEDEISKDKNAQTILRDIINGEIRFPELAFMYGYVYEKLVEHFGELFYPPNEEYSTNYYWDIKKAETYKAFIAIPFSDDFPEIYSISNADLTQEKSLFLNITLAERSDEIDEEDLNIEKEDFAFAFDRAKSENKDLVFFLY